MAKPRYQVGRTFKKTNGSAVAAITVAGAFAYQDLGNGFSLTVEGKVGDELDLSFVFSCQNPNANRTVGINFSTGGSADVVGTDGLRYEMVNAATPQTFVARWSQTVVGSDVASGLVTVVVRWRGFGTGNYSITSDATAKPMFKVENNGPQDPT